MFSVEWGSYDELRTAKEVQFYLDEIQALKGLVAFSYITRTPDIVHNGLENLKGGC
jgi:hypothetical protein